MAKIVLNDVAGGYNLQTINDNFQKIEDDLNNRVFYRDPDGETNTLLEDMDANGKRIINLPVPTLPSEPARLQDVQAGVAGGAANLILFTPAGNIAATNVQGAIQELDSETDSRLDTAEASLAKINFGGSVTISGTSTSATVTLSPAEANANYRLFITPLTIVGAPAAGSNRILANISRSVGSFTFNIETAPGTSNSVTYSWMLIRA